MDYSELANFLGNKAHRPVKGKVATSIERLENDAIAVYYHNTAVITFYPDGRIRLKTDGWETQTTKERINQYLPRDLKVYSVKREWKLIDISAGWENAKSQAFVDGMILSTV